MAEENRSVQVTTQQKAPVTFGERGVEIRDMEGAWRFSEAVYASGLAPASLVKGCDPKMATARIFTAISSGIEAGMPPMAALRSIVVISGKASWTGEAALALVRRSGLLERIEETQEGEGDALVGICKVTRRGEQEREFRFTMAEAKKAGLLSKDGPWHTYPARMVRFRSLGFALRDVFGDVLQNMHTSYDYAGEPEREREVNPVKAEAEGPDPLVEALAAPVEVPVDDAEFVDVEPKLEKCDVVGCLEPAVGDGPLCLTHLRE